MDEEAASDPTRIEVVDTVRVVDFESRWRDDFARLNVEWLERWFTVEPVDREVLGDPETHIIATGGRVLFAVDDRDRAHGTVALFKSGWIGKCVSPNYTYGGASCVGVGPRIVHATDDVYLYRTFKCGFATLSWTPAQLNAAYQHMAEIVCKEQQNDAVAYNTCLAAALKDRVGTARSSGGMGGAGLWLRDAATKGKSTLRVQVTDRFTAHVTWLGTTWKKTIQPTG